MKFSEKALGFFIQLCRFNFGRFEKEEFKKFLKLGLIFSLIIGVYWTLRPLKDAIFMQLADKMHIPYAKALSVLFLIPAVIFYTRLLERTSRGRMLIILPSFYGIAILCFSIGIGITQTSLEEVIPHSSSHFISAKVLGYIWYFFVESFGSLVCSLFWAFAVDTTKPDSAKRGFPLIVALGQIGGVILPYSIGGLPYRLELRTDTLSIVILGLLTLLILPLVRYFLKTTPRQLLLSFQKSKDKKGGETDPEPSFFEGLKLLLAHRYLLGIFAINFIYDFIMTIVDFNFKIAAGNSYSGVELSKYLSLYGSSVNFVSLFCLLLGISNITRFLSIRVALASTPIMIGFTLVGFLTNDTLSFLFALMVGAKAINYSLNGPTMKQLYIPTTTNIRFKAQAWIEIFSCRTSKEAGSIFNMLLKPLQTVFGPLTGKAYYTFLSGVISIPLLALWLMTALYLGKKFNKAIEEKKVIC